MIIAKCLAIEVEPSAGNQRVFRYSARGVQKAGGDSKRSDFTTIKSMGLNCHLAYSGFGVEIGSDWNVRALRKVVDPLGCRNTSAFRYMKRFGFIDLRVKI